MIKYSKFTNNIGSENFTHTFCQMFYDIHNCDTASYADHTTPYTSDFNLEEVIQNLKSVS